MEWIAVDGVFCLARTRFVACFGVDGGLGGGHWIAAGIKRALHVLKALNCKS